MTSGCIVWHSAEAEKRSMIRPWCAAAANGDILTMKRLWDANDRAGVHVCSVGALARPPLVWAVHFGRIDAVRLLLDYGADIDYSGEPFEEETALHMAVGMRSVQIVTLLVNRGADVNKSINMGLSPLHYAVATANYAVIKLLLDRGANPRCKKMNHQTPLHAAAQKKQIDIIKLLLAHGAAETIFWTDVLGRKPIDMIANDGPAYKNIGSLLKTAGRNHIEQCRLLATSLLLVGLDLPVLVVYTIYKALPTHRNNAVPLHRAWTVLKKIKEQP